MNSQVSVTKSTHYEESAKNQSGQIRRGPIRKFMQTIGPEMFLELEKISEEKGIHVQTLLRAVIIPEWMRDHGLGVRESSNPVLGSVSRRRGSSRSLAVH